MLNIRELKSDDIIILENTFKDIFKHNSINNHIESNPYTKYVILEKDNKIIGFINYDVIYDRLELININIIDSEKGNGYSKLLMEYMINNNEFKNITLEVRIDNEVAINLYKKYGFVNVAIRKNYYKEKDGILMERK